VRQVCADFTQAKQVTGNGTQDMRAQEYVAKTCALTHPCKLWTMKSLKLG